MATESVKILIEAEDKATAKLRAAVTEQEKAAAKAEVARVKAQKSIAAERVELEQGAEAAHAFRLELEGMASAEAALIAREKELLNQQRQRAAEQRKLADVSGARQTKAGAEFFGSIAGIAGGSEIASIASQIGGLTEKTSQFGEVAKTGGANAMLFKAGLVAAAGVLGFEVGSALGNVIFENERFNRELEKSVASLKKLEAVNLRQMQTSFSEFKIDLEFNENPGQAMADQLEFLKTELGNYQDQARATERSLKQLQEQEDVGFGDIFASSLGQQQGMLDYLESYTTDFKALKAEKERDLENERAKAELIKEQVTELERMLGIEKERSELRLQREEEKRSAEFLQSIRDEIAAVQAEIDGAANELRAQRGAGATFEDDEALRLLNQLDAAKQVLEEKRKLEREAEQEVEREKQRAKSLEDLKQRELDKIEEEVTLLTKGKEAAHALRLEKMGMSKEDAERVAAAQAELDRLQEEGRKKESTKTTAINATESRLLTRGPEQDAAIKTAENTEKTAKAAEKLLSKIDNLRSDTKPQAPVVLETVSK